MQTNDSPLNIKTSELWPVNAKKILKSKNVDIKKLKEMFRRVLFPWDDKYNTERTFFSLRAEHRPLFIVKPKSVREVEKILDYVKFANDSVKPCDKSVFHCSSSLRVTLWVMSSLVFESLEANSSSLAVSIINSVENLLKILSCAVDIPFIQNIGQVRRFDILITSIVFANPRFPISFWWERKCF